MMTIQDSTKATNKDPELLLRSYEEKPKREKVKVSRSSNNEARLDRAKTE